MPIVARDRIEDPRFVAGLLIVAAFVLRCWDFGNPVIHVDEQFYLLVGDRMRHGALPYVDIWDRKPVGLFLLYALIAALPGDDILGGQIAATAFAAATAFCIWRAGRIAQVAARPALLAATAYLIWTPILSGQGGQSPIFYNLPVAAAAILTLRLPQWRRARDPRATFLGGCIACLLAGIAIQIKYTAAFEGAYFGLAHLIYIRRAGASRAATLGAGAVWLIVGLLPTLAAIGWFAALGRPALAEFWFANFSSILSRPGYPVDVLIVRVLKISGQLLPLLVAGLLALRRADDRYGDDRPENRAVWHLLLGWVVAAVLGFIAIGTFFDHYALPLIAPLCVLAAMTFERSRRFAVVALVLAVAFLITEQSLRSADGPGARAVARVVAANSAGRGCPYLFAGDPAIYYLAKSCLPTRYVFPNHLNDTTETGAIGTSQEAEVTRIMAARPPVVISTTRRQKNWSAGSLLAFKTALTANYRPIFSAKRSTWHTIVYLRRDLPVRP